MDKVRTVTVRGKNGQGKTVTHYVEAPLCEQCKGQGFIPDHELQGCVRTCPSCNGRGEHRASDELHPQINDEFQAAI